MIRPLARPDLPRVTELWADLMANGAAVDPRFRPTDGGRAWLSAWAADRWCRAEPFPHAWIADEDDIVGFVTIWPEAASPVLEAPPVARIGDLYVAPPHRRRGLGRALVLAATGAAAAAGFSTTVVGTLARDGRAVGFWRSLGFGDWRVTLRRDG